MLETVQGKSRRVTWERDVGKGSSPLERKDLQCQGKPKKPCIFLKSKKVNHQVVRCPRPKSWHSLVMAAKPANLEPSTL